MILINFRNLFRWILTAAHCLDDGEITAQFGVDADGNFFDSITVPVGNQFVHPEYDDRKHCNDIGMSDNYCEIAMWPSRLLQCNFIF